MLTDNHGRKINYLRLAVTDRCNLRCFYCMPEDGINWLSRSELMTYEEMLRCCSMLVQMGVVKIRITGGEPFVRKDIMKLITNLSKLQDLDELTITTNGILTAPHVAELKALGVRSVNLSLDTLHPGRFFSITRRDEFANVMTTFDKLLKHDIEVKINAVVMDGKNIQDINPMVELTRHLPVSVRFIEEMPFNGNGHDYNGLKWDYLRILNEIKSTYPDIKKLDDPQYSTAYNYQIPGHKGKVGIIAAYSRTFCGTCNRIRITPDGELKTCLYDNGVLNIKDLMRQNIGDGDLKDILLNAFNKRPKDGWEAERRRTEKAGIHESMATIGG
ncbi:GTP 3',8-cyclase MoaA [Mucilaginibacter sp. L3T2-6]|uniref:GTP 3',8-cyclase MoaA n=1 Tax=Mucilaginibacter sp. L3T2-6 TaxID=3062491 RepID=UPI002675028C|nr:GTP 3',8-cyclase MoaA [Mucilaginibacter sp. L3T2-6]MDO3641203.1 GTP 3',8-cyclase MoaA [Mucilaginibacter sp. L3T2-6]MDV6213321.1 GTP 3',8-cyclase MoaA [Mucilaginibacter sp. L3T2-6]